MQRLIISRVASMIPLLLIISLLVSALIELVPGDPAYAILGDNATAQAVANVRAQLGLDEPFFQRYFSWVADAARGDLGRSLFGGQRVIDAISARAPVTISLVGFAVLIQAAVGMTAGVVAGFRPYRGVDRVSSFVASLFLAIPGFWLGMLLIVLVAERWELLPATNYVPFTRSVVDWFRHLILPASALAAAGAAELFRQTRSAVIDTSRKDFVRTARAFGIPERQIAMRTVVKNAMVPVITVFGLQLGRMIGIAAVVESVFGMQGIGSLAVTASLNGDFPVVQGVVLITASVVLVANLLVDISYRYFNPKLRAT